MVVRRDGAAVVTLTGFQAGLLRTAHTILYAELMQLTEDEQESSQTLAAFDALGEFLDGVPEVIRVVEEET